MQTNPDQPSATSTFRVIYGESPCHFKDFGNIGGVLAFVRSLRVKHSDWTIGDSWRDQVSVCELYWNANGCRDTRDCSAFVSQVLAG